MTIFSRTNSSHPGKSVLDDSEFGTITFIANSRSKSLRLSILPFQGLQVTLPRRYSQKKALVFVNSKREWVHKALARVALTESRSREFFESAPTVKRQDIRVSLVNRLSELAEQHDFQFGKVSIRDQKSRWGSCSSSNNISLNQKLYYLPDHLRDYVLVHELAHTRQKNHSRAFWDIIFSIDDKDKVKLMRRDLRRYEFLFYPPPHS